MQRIALTLRGWLLLGWWVAPAAMGMGYEIVGVYPHDSDAYTQGLVFDGGYLYESTGLKGHSSVRKVDLLTGDAIVRHNLAPTYFGEGIAILDGRLLQLTWRSNRGFVYDLDELRPLATFDYPTEGWGLTHDGERLIMSDGTARLYFLDPGTFETVDSISVTDGAAPLDKLNELEYIDGLVYANVFQTARVAVIDPVTGLLVDSLDLSQLVEAERALTQSAGVLNGIAYDPDQQRLFVTGKNWRRLYAIRLTPGD